MSSLAPSNTSVAIEDNTVEWTGLRAVATVEGIETEKRADHRWKASSSMEGKPRGVGYQVRRSVWMQRVRCSVPMQGVVGVYGCDCVSLLAGDDEHP